MKTTLYTGTSTDANMEDFAFYLMDFDTLGQTSTAALTVQTFIISSCTLQTVQ
ncbi:MAG: hypothetical protein ACLUHJ_04025 [Ruminococcus sp.]